MTTLTAKKATVLQAVRKYLQINEGRVVEKISRTGTVYFHTKKDGAFCGKLIRVADHSTPDKTVLISLRYDKIGNNTTHKAVVTKITNTLNNCASLQSRRRLGWLFTQI